MLTTRWTMLGPPTSPRIAPVRGVGNVRITAEDIERFGGSTSDPDPEVLLERVLDDPGARYRIAGLAPKQEAPAPAPAPVEKREKSAGTTRPKRGGKRSWLAALFGR